MRLAHGAAIFIWSFATKAAVESSLAVVNGKVYTGGDDGNVYCLDAYNGNLIWTTPHQR